MKQNRGKQKVSLGILHIVRSLVTACQLCIPLIASTIHYSLNKVETSEMESRNIQLGRWSETKDWNGTRTVGLEWNQDRQVSYLIQAKCFGDGKAPSSLECSPDHGRAGGGCGRGKTKRVLKVEAGSLDTYVH